MTNNSNFKTNGQIRFMLILLLASMAWLADTKKLRINASTDTCTFDYKESNCLQGSYNITLNRRGGCVIREYCYSGLAAQCDRNSDEFLCAPGLYCSCGQCMGCLADECYMELCPNRLSSKRWISPHKNNWLGFNKRGSSSIGNGYSYDR